VVGQAAWASVATAMHGRIRVVSFLRYARSGKTEERRGGPGTHLRAAEGTGGSWAATASLGGPAESGGGPRVQQLLQLPQLSSRRVPARSTSGTGDVGGGYWGPGKRGAVG
jgi:hypothetical protein